MHIKYLSKCPYFKETPLPGKILGYAPGLFQNLEDLGFCSNSLWRGFLIYVKKTVYQIIFFTTSCQYSGLVIADYKSQPGNQIIFTLIDFGVLLRFMSII